MATVSGPVSGSAQLGAIYLLHCGVGGYTGGIQAAGAIQLMDHLPWLRRKGVVLPVCLSQHTPHPIPRREKLSPRKAPEWCQGLAAKVRGKGSPD